MNQKRRENIELAVEVHRLQGEMAALERECENIHEQHQGLRRQSANRAREIRNHEEINRSLKEQEKGLQVRRRELEFRDLALTQKRAIVEHLENEVHLLKVARKKLSQKVNEIEAKARESELSNTILFEQIQDESAGLSVYLLELGHSHHPANLSFQEEFAASFLDFG
jgi:chromosome segregation ATPase